MTSLQQFIRIIRGEFEEEEDESIDSDHWPWQDEIETTRDLNQFPASSTKPGSGLLASGEFGRIGVKRQAQQGNPNVVRTIFKQRTRAIPVHHKEEIQSKLVPNSNGVTVANYDARVYTASFSKDSSFFYTCSQGKETFWTEKLILDAAMLDFKLHIFDVRKPPLTDHGLLRRDGLLTRMPVRKVIQGHQGNWTITDADLSPNNEQLIYSSISPTVYLTSISPDGNPAHTPIFLGDTQRPRYGLLYDDNVDRIWSCHFSADGKEVVAGGNGRIVVYDLLANKRTIKINAHRDDVNSCCWADAGSGNILVSGSDDTYLKVWDRRSLGATKKPAGLLMGHTEGITFVSAKGDGRYIISNGKDQCLRLWDLRRMRTNTEHEAVEANFYGIPKFDYRYSSYTRPRYKAHPMDCSVMTYKGHRVLQTLIRCHFSPAETTGAQYLYSGSADGRIHIWSLDGRVVHILDRSKTLPFMIEPSGPEYVPTSSYARKACCVRDVSWHTQEPVMMSAGWSRGTDIARHEYKGLSKMAYALEDWAEKNRQTALEINRRSRLRGRRHSFFHETSD